MILRTLFLLLTLLLPLVGVDAEPVLVRLPPGGVQPQAVMDGRGVVHVIYLDGEPTKADVFYIRSNDYGRSFSKPLRVNSQPGSAVAAGSIRGAQIAIGGGGLVHVAWNGSSVAKPKGPLNPEMPAESPHNGTPMLYSRLGGNGVFEPQRNLMTKTFGLDGGGSIAADQEGNVYVAWHAKAPGAGKGEDGRRVWLVRSVDNGKTFSAEEAKFGEETGACGCCGMRIFADSGGELWVLYRSAHEIVHRDVYLLHSVDRGATFESSKLHPWEIGACPMSAMAFSEGARGLLATWETDKQVYVTDVRAHIERRPRVIFSPTKPQGSNENRKLPSIAQDSRGDVLQVWTINTGWGKAPRLAWSVARFQTSDATEVTEGIVGEIPAWSFAATFARPDGSFVILY